MRSKLLSETIRDLKLDPYSPYPYQVVKRHEDAEEVRRMIRGWRDGQRLQLVAATGPERGRNVCPACNPPILSIVGTTPEKGEGLT